MRLSPQGLKSLASSIAFGTAARNVALGVMLPVALASTIVVAEAKPAAKAKAAHAAPAATEQFTGAPATYMPGAVPPPGVNARSWVLVDATSNTVLASGNADERVEPASLTKLMTAYLVFEALDKKKISMEQIVTPSEAVRRVGRDESRMFIEANKPVSVHDLVYGMIIQSGNDAAIALAELVGGSEGQFVTLMNDEAQRLGMKGTHFADVNGMPDPNHYTTAGDLAKLSAHLIRDFPQYYSIFSEGIQVQQHPPGQPQPPAVARPDGRRPEDGPYASSRLLPDRVGEACDPGRGRPAPPGVGDDGRAEGRRAHAGQHEDAELRLQRVRFGAPVQGR